MPKVNGLDVLKIIKDTYPDLDFVIVTGYKPVETASETSSLGACGYIVKPFNSDEILQAIGKLIKA